MRSPGKAQRARSWKNEKWRLPSRTLKNNDEWFVDELTPEKKFLKITRMRTRMGKRDLFFWLRKNKQIIMHGRLVENLT